MWWSYHGIINISLIFCVLIAFSPFGAIRLSQNGEGPSFSFITWVSMFFSAGIGIGLLFYGIYEPAQHYNNYIAHSYTAREAYKETMSTTFLHWGVHGWSVYALVALATAYMHYCRGYPLAISSTAISIFSKKTRPFAKTFIDVSTILGAIFGISTSLAIGIKQTNAGLANLLGIPTNTYIQMGALFFITVLTSLSVLSGITRGIKILSGVNVIISIVILCLVATTTSNFSILENLYAHIVNYSKNMGRYAIGNHMSPNLSWIKKILSCLPKKATYYFCQANIERSLNVMDLYLNAKKFKLNGSVFKNTNIALCQAKKNANKNDLILVTGSAFIVSEVV